MDNILINIGGVDLTFTVIIEHDTDNGAPWENEDGHGPVSEWTTRDKRAGELVLNSDRGSKRFYDFAEACRKALAEAWDAAPYNDGTETKRQQAAKAARANFEHLRAWCNDEWRYVGVSVVLLDQYGESTDIRDSVRGVEDSDQCHIEETARQIADELAHGMGTQWDYETVTSQRPAWLKSA